MKIVFTYLNDDGSLKSTEELEFMYNIKIDQMRYNSLTHAIPKNWSYLVKGKNLDLKLVPVDHVELNNKEVPWTLHVKNCIKISFLALKNHPRHRKSGSNT